MPYDLEPSYEVIGGPVDVGYEPLVRALRATSGVVAIDGPAALPWDSFIAAVRAAVGDARYVDAREHYRDWSEIDRMTDATLRGDPVFATIPHAPLSSLMRETLPDLWADDGLAVVFGPGSAFFGHDVLWYADLPKRLALDAIAAGRARNLGQPAGARGDLRRLLFIDWPIEDRHRRDHAARWERYVDLTAVGDPRSLSAPALAATMKHLAGGPFRTRPTFLPEPWGGRWLSEELGAPGGPKLGLGYELIAPEAGLLFGGDRPIEVPLDLIVTAERIAVLGASAATGGNGSFPIRFDYLDTMGGGDLSVHCHPRADYMRDVFGHSVAQHETYYVMREGPGRRIFLGLREDTDLAEFRDAVERSLRERTALAIDRFVDSVPSRRHQLYLVPAGTPHGSGEGNVVLEISATPYLYSLRFYDWLRADLDGELRPVQPQHAFANLAAESRGAAARELVPEPVLVRDGERYQEVAFPRHAELFFSVHRIAFDGPVPDRTGDRFHVLNLAEGEDIEIRTATGRRHRLAYAETIVVPAAAGEYELAPLGPGRRIVVKAFVV
ncbi:MAG TPA: class I mannose-6-phosphate isomerase [Candidatus Limnocylindria bacterium]